MRHLRLALSAAVSLILASPLLAQFGDRPELDEVHLPDLDSALEPPIDQLRLYTAMNTLLINAQITDIEPGEFAHHLDQLSDEWIDYLPKDSHNLLHQAAAMCQDDLVDMLLSRGADVNIRNGMGNTALHNAILMDCSPTLLLTLLNAGADINARGWKGESPLHLAVSLNHQMAFSILIEREDLHIDPVQSKGSTPLMYALAHQNQLLADALIARGASLSKTNHSGVSGYLLAKDEARQKELRELADLHESQRELLESLTDEDLYTEADFAKLNKVIGKLEIASGEPITKLGISERLSEARDLGDILSSEIYYRSYRKLWNRLSELINNPTREILPSIEDWLLATEKEIIVERELNADILKRREDNLVEALSLRRLRNCSFFGCW